MIKQFYNWLASPPESIAQEHRRTYNLAIIMGMVCGLGHVFTLLLCLIFKVTPLFYVNIGSVTLFTFVVYIVRRTGRAADGLILMSCELLIHQIIAVYFLGWGLGYQYFLFPIASIMYLGHYRRRTIPLLFVFMSSLAFIWLYYWGQHLFDPHYSIPEPTASIIFIYNITSTFAGMAVVSIIYSRTAISMEKKLEAQNREIREAQLMLVQSEKMAAIGKLAAGLTHEINNPIGAIISNSQTGARAIERLKESINDTVSPSENMGKPGPVLDVLGQTFSSTVIAGKRLSELVGRLKNFVHIDEAELQSVNLHDGIESALVMLEDQIQQGPIEIVRNFDTNIPDVECHAADVNQVFIHLLQNAIDAIDGAGTISLTTDHSDSRVTVAIHDTGRGIAPENLETIFDPSFTSDQSRVKMRMGMPISRQIVNQHNGELRVDSKLGEGTIVTIVLPVKM